MKLLVTTSDDQIVVVDVNPDMSLSDLKALLEFETDIAPGEQLIAHHGTLLQNNNKTLGAYGIGDNDAMVVSRQFKRPELPVAGGATASGSGSWAHPILGQIDRASFLRHIASRDPNLAQAAQRDPVILDKLIRNAEEQQRELAVLEADPFSPEAQEKIANLIRLRNVEDSYQSALEHNPETFSHVTMLYVNCMVNKHPVKAFVDSGAGVSVMGAHFTETCGLSHLIDTRFHGMAKGVGTSKIIGRIHRAELVVGGRHLVCAFNVLNIPEMDVLIGLDMLRRHQATIDLKTDALIFDDISVPFLHEHEVPNFARDSKTDDPKMSTPLPPGDPVRHQAPGPIAARAPVTSPTQHQAPGPSAVKVPTTSPASRFSENAIAQIVNLGASREVAIRLLTQANGNVEMAGSLFFS
ncbi:DNA damage-inducible protein 1 [Dimargaris cristalligena]|nr:DNA damage-inducible protein 1 [Dimargaris cristalligena]